MSRTKPWLDEFVECLGALDEKEPRNITEVVNSTGISRNVASAILKSCVSYGLANISFEGRSERFNLTPKAKMYLMILHADLQPIGDQIQEVMVAATNHVLDGNVDPDEYFEGLVGTIESDTQPSYSRLQALADAFTTATNRYFEGTVEHRVFSELASLLRTGTSLFFSPFKQTRDAGKKLLQRACDLLRSMQKTNRIIAQEGLHKTPLDLEELGKDERGQPIYRVR
ncbi:MAG: hypothetical protein WCD81_04960 [Candidatus Bathyarchaeia archaeon]